MVIKRIRSAALLKKKQKTSRLFYPRSIASGSQAPPAAKTTGICSDFYEGVPNETLQRRLAGRQIRPMAEV